MRLFRRDKDESAPRRDFTSGCVGILFEIGVWTLSTIFVTIGGAMFVFGVLSFETEVTFASVFALLAVPVTIFLFLKIGSAILRDLRNQDGES